MTDFDTVSLVAKVYSISTLEELKVIHQLTQSPLVCRAFGEGIESIKELFGMALYTAEDFLMERYGVAIRNTRGRFYLDKVAPLNNVVMFDDDVLSTRSIEFVRRLRNRYCQGLPVMYSTRGAGYRANVENVWKEFNAGAFVLVLEAIEELGWAQAPQLRQRWSEVEQLKEPAQCTASEHILWGLFFHELQSLLVSKRQDKTFPEVRRKVSTIPENAHEVSDVLLNPELLGQPVIPIDGRRFGDIEKGLLRGVVKKCPSYEQLMVGEQEVLVSTRLDLFQVIGSSFSERVDVPALSEELLGSRGNPTSTMEPCAMAAVPPGPGSNIQSANEPSTSGEYASIVEEYREYVGVDMNSHKSVQGAWKSGGNLEGARLLWRSVSAAKKGKFASLLPSGTSDLSRLMEIFHAAWGLPLGPDLADMVISQVMLRLGNLGRVSFGPKGSGAFALSKTY